MQLTCNYICHGQLVDLIIIITASIIAHWCLHSHTHAPKHMTNLSDCNRIAPQASTTQVYLIQSAIFTE